MTTQRNLNFHLDLGRKTDFRCVSHAGVYVQWLEDTHLEEVACVAEDFLG
jgi:hypothetical protein